MKRIFFISLFIISLKCLGQETQDFFLKNSCEFKTDGQVKAKGVKLKLSVPCDWDQAEGDRPNIVKKFSYSFNSGGTIVQTLLIKQLPSSISKSEIDEMLSPTGLKELGESLGTFVSGKRIKIDGLDCGEIITKVVRETPLGTIYGYTISYYLIHKDKLIILSFMAGANSYSISKDVYDNYNILFKSIANSLVILSRWE